MLVWARKYGCTEETAERVFAAAAKGNRRLTRAAMLLTVMGVALVLASQTQAQQSAPSGTREAEFSVFGGYTHSLPDYGPFGDNGATVGVDYTRYYHRLLAPSLEARFNFNNGKTINETNSLVGLRLQADMKRFHPYGDFFIGAGHLTFKQPIPSTYTHDTAFAKAVGGGVNFDVSRYFQLKADCQYEFLNFGQNNLVPANHNFSLSPTSFTAGVVYRIPFRRGYQKSIQP